LHVAQPQPVWFGSARVDDVLLADKGTDVVGTRVTAKLTSFNPRPPHISTQRRL
jgi:hypothetical protein